MSTALLGTSKEQLSNYLVTVLRGGIEVEVHNVSWSKKIRSPEQQELLPDHSRQATQACTGLAQVKMLTRLNSDLLPPESTPRYPNTSNKISLAKCNFPTQIESPFPTISLSTFPRDLTNSLDKLHVKFQDLNSQICNLESSTEPHSVPHANC